MTKKTNKTKYALLGTLSLGEKSGYDIKKFIEGSLGNFWSESYGQIYPILKEMEAEGLATRSVEDSGKGRNVYAITEDGLGELRDWLKEPTELPMMRNELLLKLFFGAEVPLGVSVTHVQAARAEVVQVLAKYAEIERRLSDPACAQPSTPYSLLTLRFGRRTMQAILEWCDEALETLDGLATP